MNGVAISIWGGDHLDAATLEFPCDCPRDHALTALFLNLLQSLPFLVCEAINVPFSVLQVVSFGLDVSFPGIIVSLPQLWHGQVPGCLSDAGSHFQLFPFHGVDPVEEPSADGSIPESHLAPRASSGRGVGHLACVVFSTFLGSRKHALGFEVVNGIGFLCLCLSQGGSTSPDGSKFQSVLSVEDVVAPVQFPEERLEAFHTFGVVQLQSLHSGGSHVVGLVAQGRLEGDVYPEGMVISRVLRCVKVTSSDDMEGGSAKDSIYLSVAIAFAT